MTNTSNETSPIRGLYVNDTSPIRGLYGNGHSYVREKYAEHMPTTGTPPVRDPHVAWYVHTHVTPHM